MLTCQANVFLDDYFNVAANTLSGVAQPVRMVNGYLYAAARHRTLLRSSDAAGRRQMVRASRDAGCVGVGVDGGVGGSTTRRGVLSD